MSESKIFICDFFTKLFKLLLIKKKQSRARDKIK